MRRFLDTNKFLYDLLQWIYVQEHFVYVLHKYCIFSTNCISRYWHTSKAGVTKIPACQVCLWWRAGNTVSQHPSQCGSSQLMGRLTDRCLSPARRGVLGGRLAGQGRKHKVPHHQPTDVSRSGAENFPLSNQFSKVSSSIINEIISTHISSYTALLLFYFF